MPIHIGDAGTVIRTSFTDEATNNKISLTGMTLGSLTIVAPSGARIERPLSAGSDQYEAVYTVAAGDFTEVGIHRIQGVAVLPSGTWHSTPISVLVSGNL